MARPLRVNRANGWYHAYARGLNRMDLYADERDRKHFLELLEEMVERYRVQMHAYVLMDNHFHLVVRTPDANLSRSMQWLNLSYAAWFNVRHQRTGPVFQRPFGSVPVQDGAWIYELSLYVHLNPLRIAALGLSKQERKAANMGAGPAPSRQEIDERMRRLREYRWSSYLAYAGYEQAPPWLCLDDILHRAAAEESDRTGTYRKDVRRRAAEGGDSGKLEAVRDHIAIGGAAFVKAVKQTVQAGVPREAGSKRAWRARVTIEEVFAAVARVRGQPWEQIVARHGDFGRPMAMWMARRFTGLTLRQIGDACGNRDYAATAMAIRRFQSRLEDDKSLAGQTRELSQMLHVKMSPQ